MNRRTILILLYAAFALASCQKKEIENPSSNSLIASSNAAQINAFYRYFYKGTGNSTDANKIFSGNSVNGSNWTFSALNNSGLGANGSPAATVFNGNIYVFHRSATSNYLYYTRSADLGGSWAADAMLGNFAATSGDLSACTYGGKMFLAYPSNDFHLGNNSTTIHYSYSSDGSNWTEVNLPYTSFGDPYIFTFHSAICILYTSTLSPAPAFTILTSVDGINWTKGSQLNFGYFRYAAATPINSMDLGTPPSTVIVGMDPDGQLKTTMSTDLVNWTTPVKITTRSGQLAYTSRRPAISGSCGVVIYKAKTNASIIYALPGGDNGYLEWANAIGTTDESPFMIDTP